MAQESIPTSIKAGGLFIAGGLVGTVGSGIVFYKNHPELDWKESGGSWDYADFSQAVTEWGAAEWGIVSLIPLIAGLFLFAHGLSAHDGHDDHDHHHGHHH